MKDQSDHLMAFQGRSTFAALLKIRTAENVPLKKLDLLRWETNCLGRFLGRNTGLISRDQLVVVSAHLASLLQVVVDAHYDSCNQAQFSGIRDSIPSGEQINGKDGQEGTTAFLDLPAKGPNSHHFQNIAKRYLVPALKILRDNQQAGIAIGDLARAWTLFGLGCLLLYVPNLPFDPSMKTRLESNVYRQRRDALTTKLQASREVERVYTGQLTSLRCEMMEKDLKDLGTVNCNQDVFRPDISQLDELQAEFNSLLQSVVAPCQDSSFIQELVSAKDNSRRSLNTLRANIGQLVHRLSSKYRPYDDIIVPLVGFLACLDLGLSLAGLGSLPRTDSISNASSIRTPAVFLGPTDWSLVATLPQGVDKLESTDLKIRLECLHEFAVLAKVEGLGSLCGQEQRTLLSIFQSIYRHWKREVEADKQAHAAKTGLYRFRSGEDELADDEEELKELFPTNEISGETEYKTTEANGQAQRLTLELANLHSAIFGGTNQPADQMLQLVEERAKKHSEPDQLPGAFLRTQSTTENLLPGLIVSTYRLKSSLSATTIDPDLYDFYRDPNLGEVSKLLDLVRTIHHRFSELLALWPEHATLHDVKTTCEEVSVVRHTEPLGRVLGKVERLHRHLHEWQLVASREFSVEILFAGITSMIVSWRRLELRTWARLFELEEQKCEEQAKAWWFMAYEMIVALPMSTDPAEEAPEKPVANLLSVLETFASTTTLGQFLPRLHILRHLNGHAALAAKHFERMEGIHTAPSNFLNYYNSFTAAVEKVLKEGKQALSKQMKEVILLASWKDTNIDALRESARRSHHKLLGVVRRYRDLLAQPVNKHLGMGQLKPMATAVAPPKLFISPVLSIEPGAVDLCMSSVTGWVEKHRPWIKPEFVYKDARSIGKALGSSNGASGLLEDFSSRLTLSIKELQKETPSVQTEHNKVVLALLKRRKRKLFAETLRDLRRMGFQYNLSTDFLAAQDSLSTVFGRVKPFQKAARFEGVEAIDEYFHHILDLMKVARKSTSKHSEDLTKAEVARSIGYLEGIFLTILKQREVLVAALRQSTALATVSDILASLKWTEENELQSIGPASDQEMKRLQRSTTWLPMVLETSIRVLKMQIEMAEIETSRVPEDLSVWKQRFETLSRRWKSLPALPTGIITTEHTQLQTETEHSLNEFRAEIRQWSEQQPLFGYLLKQLLAWELAPSLEQTPNAQESLDLRSGLAETDVKISAICEDIHSASRKTHDLLSGEKLSEQNPAWLLQYHEKINAAIRTVQGPEVAKRLQTLMARLPNLNVEQLKVASAIVATALPTFQHYRNIYDETVHLYMNLHSSTCRLAYVLAKAYNQLAAEGYCAPSDSSGSKEGKLENAENGTGLGEGEGAEDISKDIADDESLPDLAQEPNQEKNGKELEDEKDAVQMADEMEGEDVEKLSQADDEKDDSGDGGSEKSEIDEEIDDVDNLDPSAVDEKVGGRDGDQADKQQLADKSQGKPDKDEQGKAAAVEEANGDLNDEEDMDEMSVDEAEEVVDQDLQEQNPYSREQDTLDLPEDLDFEDKQSTRSDDMESGSEGGVSLSDEEGPEPMEIDADVDDADDANDKTEARSEGEQSESKEDEEEGGMKDAEVIPEKNEDEVAGDIQDLSLKDTDPGLGDADDSGASRAAGVEDHMSQEIMDQTIADSEQAQAGPASGDTANRTDSSNRDVESADSRRQAGQSLNQQDAQSPHFQDDAQTQAFKQLGDVLRDWQYRPRKIREASDQEMIADEVPQQNTEGAELEHLREDDEAADTQALGTATEEQAHALDQSKILEGRDQQESGLPPEESIQEEKPNDEGDPMDIDQGAARENQQEPKDEEQQGPVAMLSDRRNPASDFKEIPDSKPQDPEDEQMEETHTETQLQLSGPSSSRSTLDSQSLWTLYETETRPHSLILTEQLRLILNPTVASKMQGDFRTGKRLNIKRIIPYIASRYRRDKIWMRRSKPGKRSYQIMLAVDDSKSMAEGGAGDLALQTLVMVSRSLSMLESGQLCIVAFGENVRVAHAFETPFSPASGPGIFEHFGFQQTRTEVKTLLSQSITLFRSARLRASPSSSSSGADPWQLQLIISDGLCEDHGSIRRLVRQAQEERIMIIFVIVDNIGQTKGKGRSILEMSQAVFEAEDTAGGAGGSGAGGGGAMKVKMQRYLDSFPFPYYLVVGDVKALPGVLSTALRQWFKEVVDAGY